LLNKAKMEARRVGNGLEVSRNAGRGAGPHIVIVSGNRREFPLTQPRNGLRECIAEVRVSRAAAIPCPPAGVHRELHEVGKTSTVLLGAIRLAAWERAKLLQINRVGAPGNQVRINKREVAELIVSIVVNILIHIPIEHAKGSRVRRVPRPAGNFAVLDASQLIVLLPQIGFEDFRGSQEAENSDVPFGEATPVCFSKHRKTIGQQSGADGACTSCEQSPTQKGAAACRIF
jgi:hypothetical protein